MRTEHVYCDACGAKIISGNYAYRVSYVAVDVRTGEDSTNRFSPVDFCAWCFRDILKPHTHRSRGGTVTPEGDQQNFYGTPSVDAYRTTPL